MLAFFFGVGFALAWGLGGFGVGLVYSCLVGFWVWVLCGFLCGFLLGLWGFVWLCRGCENVVGAGL